MSNFVKEIYQSSVQIVLFAAEMCPENETQNYDNNRQAVLISRWHHGTDIARVYYISSKQLGFFRYHFQYLCLRHHRFYQKWILTIPPTRELHSLTIYWLWYSLYRTDIVICGRDMCGTRNFITAALPVLLLVT